MYEIKELRDSFNWSYNQIRDRILRLDDSIDNVSERGKKNKIFISEKGLSLLRQLKDLEDNGKSIKSSVETIIKDLEDDQDTGGKNISKLEKTSVNQGKSREVELLEQSIKELQKDKERLQGKVDTLEERLLPSGERKTPFQGFRQWLGI